MKRILTLSFLAAAMLVPTSVALAAPAPGAPIRVANAKAIEHTAVAGGASGSIGGIVAISTFSENCTGAVIAPRVVLTAGHCLNDVLDKATIRVRLAHSHQNLGVSDYYTAPGYEPTTHYDDAAVLILKSPSKEPALQLVRSEPSAGTGAMITGYGQQTYTSAIATVAHHADTTIQSFASCQQSWAEFGTALPDSDICAQNSSDTDTVTRGDSGGPLLVKSQAGTWRVAGINDLIVIPNNAYNDAIPQAFGRVNTIRPWIESEIAQFG